LDGVLIDSRRAVKAAYYAAGIEVPPESWGKPWREWLIDACEGDEAEARRVHDLKNEHYPVAILREARRLPCAALAESLYEVELPVYVITGASRDAAMSCMMFLGLDLQLLHQYECTQRDKERVLGRIAEAFHPVGVYYDDHPTIVPSGWAWARVVPKEIRP
jgi:hypothetical protein